MLEKQSKPISIYERFPVLKEIEKKEKFPNHVAIILDGNRRWAQKIYGNVDAVIGHKAGANRIINVLREIREIEPIKFMTLWALSPENWKRPEKEIGDLMELFITTLPKVLPEIVNHNGKLIHLGRKDRIPVALKKAIENAEKKTENNTGQTLCIAIDYGLEDQEIRAMQKIVDMQLPRGTIITSDIRKSLLDTRLPSGFDIPPIDLVIRTSGEMRLSGLPNAEYAEFYSVQKSLPDFKTEDFVEALINYTNRERRFGARPK